MAPLLKRTAQKKRRRVRTGGEDQRATALRMAGLELLANTDFENVSIARIAKEAKCSVGSFYYRYKDKNAYLRQLISATFRGLENSLQNHLSNSGSQISLSEFLTHIITKLSTFENVGIIRAALKLAATDSDALQPYVNYREFVANTAENIFKGGTRKKIRASEIREVVQIVFATINDAALMPKSAAMKLGSEEILNSLCEMAATRIGVKPDFTGKITKTTVIMENKPDEAPEIDKAEIAQSKKKSVRLRRAKITVL